MNRVSREKNCIASEVSEDKGSEGTSARTRAFSLEQILVRRKNKVAENVEPDKVSKEDKSEVIKYHSDASEDYRKSKSSDIGTKHISHDITKRNYRKKDKDIRDSEYTTKRDYMMKEKDIRDSDATKRDSIKKEKYSRDSENATKKDPIKKESDSRDSEYTRKRISIEKERDSRDSENTTRRDSIKKEKDNRHSDTTKRDFIKKEKDSRYSEAKPREMIDKNMLSIDRIDMKYKERQGKSSNQEYSKDSINSHSRNKFPEKSDKYHENERRKYEREVKRKHISDDSEKSRSDIRDENVTKKQNSEKRRDLSPAKETSRDKETSLIHKREDRPKRKRSKSRESRDKERVKRTSYDSREHKDPVKDRYSDVDRIKIASNGGYSSSQNRHHGNAPRSGLGGYSPRRRRSEAAIKTPSPTSRSPEKKGAGWDLPLTSGISHPILTSRASTSSSTSPETSTISKNLSSNTAQLAHTVVCTQKLYIENLPADASEKSVLECLNSFLMSAGGSFNQVVQSCISCNIDKAKSGALVEFISPEIARVALSFDGRSISGSIVRVRPSKDLAEVVNGIQEKSVAVVDDISKNVEDSPHKIFIGGISKVLSPKMLMEIVSAFGTLRAFRFQFHEELNESYAYLEYIDHSVTLNACAGLNGMKLGGRILTVVRAVPDEPTKENSEKTPFYGIPEHAKPLLSEPTNVLKLKHAVNKEEFSLFSESDLEEILEDIRLECSRFGTVKSVNIAKYEIVTVPEASEITQQTDTKISSHDPVSIICAEGTDNEIKEDCSQEAVEGMKVSLEERGNEDGRGSDKLVDDLNKIEMNGYISKDCRGSDEVEGNSKVDTKESFNQIETGVSNSENNNNDPRSSSAFEDPKQEEIAIELLEKPPTELKESSVGREPDVSNKVVTREHISSYDDIFEQGSIFVEYIRAEASSAAAHCLHGRLYGRQVVVIDYVSHDLYISRYPK